MTIVPLFRAPDVMVVNPGIKMGARELDDPDRYFHEDCYTTHSIEPG
jgi:hypothetical protein